MHPVEIQLSDHRTSDAERDAALAAPVFGASFTDHMVVMEFGEPDGRPGWGPLRLQPFAPLVLSPATLALHYGQSIFEALKAYSCADGEVVLFRPDRNEQRMDASARRIAMPALPDGAFRLGCALLAAADREWVPTTVGAALYVRPFLFGSEAHLSVRPSHEYLFVVIASPVASYFGDHLSAITVAVERDDVRATPGGTGAAKFAGNYAAGFAAHGRSIAAGCDQVLWLDAVEHRWVEELNAMNVVFVWDRNGRPVVTTPPLGGTILDGVTRDSLLSLAADAGLEVIEEPTSIDMIRAGLVDGSLREMFACGTAAVIAPIGRLVDHGEVLVIGDGEPGPVTLDLRHRLIGLQQGRAADPHGWTRQVDELLVAGGVDPDSLR